MGMGATIRCFVCKDLRAIGWERVVATDLPFVVSMVVRVRVQSAVLEVRAIRGKSSVGRG